MEEKRILCAMISTDLHAKIMAEKEQLELNTLAEYVERIFTEHFEGGQISMKAERTLAVQIPGRALRAAEGISGSPQPQAKAVPHPDHRKCVGRYGKRITTTRETAEATAVSLVLIGGD